MKIDMILLFIIAAFVAFTLFSRNMVYSLVSLVGAFFFSGALLVWMGLEFLGYVLIIVYVGAIAILLLFVVMTLDVNRESYASPSWVLDYVPHVFSLAFTAGVLKIVYESVEPLVAPANLGPIFDAWVATALSSNNLASLYFTLYLPGFPFLFISGLLLLLAMMGAVFLTQSQREVNGDGLVLRKPSRSSRVGRKF
uniref:NADH-ubiquinone oxidoreductase chain 6 n=1 Tax=Lotharella oceanica TaxID=641309 RepID=A0A140GYS1_9EUKA|nr:NADH dehydrogenase subunit 6 [Lotharella oceanica]AMN87093.1 NADH dehydrogenase subunit 6 [Lotharella oceanica]